MPTDRDPSSFHLLNVVDSCAVWNIISSNLLKSTAYSAGCHFCCTDFVYYECLHKPRKQIKSEDFVLKERLQKEIGDEKFKNYHLDIEDLQEVEILEKRKNLGKGELASIVFAKKTRQAFLTDDGGARNLAEEVMHQKLVQTTAHLLGWLFFANFLGDSDYNIIVNEHIEQNGNLEKHFQIMYHRALDFRAKQYFSA